MFLLVAVNAKYIHSNPAIYSLRGFVKEEQRQQVMLAEYTINQTLSSILADIYKRKPSVIGFSCYIWNWEMIREILEELPKLLPNTDIWLGGPEVSFDAPELLKKYPSVKGVMIGEGEATFAELLDLYLEKNWSSKNISEEKFKKVSGLCLRSGYTPMRELTNMSELPFLYDDLQQFENRIIYYESSRGCPYRCSYCLSSIDKKVRIRDFSVVERELAFFLENKVSQVKFVDRTFNCDHDHAMKIWNYINEHDNGVTNFHFEISADILREDEIALLNSMRPGLVQLEIGVQTTNPQTIKAIDRVMNVEKLEAIVAAVHRGNNIHQHLDLIAGLPYEDYESFGRSFDRVYAMEPQQLQLGFLKVLKGSPMSERAEEYGLAYMGRPPYEVLYTKWLPYDDVLRLKDVEEMVEIYYNSNQFTHTLPFLVKAFKGPFEMFEKLAEFYREKGYFTNSPARAYRYHVLLDFCKEYNNVNLPVYKELLLFDMYLRENLKSRPEFAIDLSESEIKSQIRSFYQMEDEQRLYLTDYAGYDWKQLSKMTHLEPFSYAVWDVTQLKNAASVLDEKVFLLFDYKNRSPLTGEAKTQIVKTQIVKSEGYRDGE